METKFMRLEDLEELERKLRSQMDDVAEKVKVAKQEKRQLELAGLKPLVIKAHDILCGWNHTDGCGWQYEVNQGEHNWTGKYSAHASWLERVEKWLQHKRFGTDLTVEKLDAILDHIKAGKAMHPDYLFIIREVIRGN